MSYSSVGCTTRDSIDRVQPQAFDKSFFVGQNLADASDDPEFYMRNTVIDVPYGATQDGLFTASYAQPINRIKWEITENQIIARLTYEQITGSDHKGAKTSNSGQVVAAFAITSHFDKRQDYNPGTGEETNVTVENTTDRPWYQREYMHVDWSRNLITTAYNLDTLAQLGLYGGVEFESLAYTTDDPNDPNRPVLSPTEGYFDVTNKIFAKPTVIDTPWGAFPSCFFFGTFPAGKCDPTEATLRLSFKKVVETDFEPSEWDGKRMDAFGVFYQERQGYERNYGVSDAKWHRFASKYNFWKRSHISTGEGEEEVFAQCGQDFWRDAQGNIGKYAYDGESPKLVNGFPVPDANGRPVALTGIGQDANRGFKENGVADECAAYGVAGSRCDTISNRCTMPLFARETKTIPWYYGPDAPADLFASTANAAGQWNLAIKSAIQVGRKAEWDRLQGALDGTEEAPFKDNDLVTEDQLVADAALGKNKLVKDVIVLCHNPVMEGDDEACGRVGLRVRIGDIRYNTINLIDSPQMGSPWGIMVDGDDPLTGEKVTTSVNEWIAVLDLASQGAMDTIRWLNGEISDDDVVSGRYLNDWLNATNRGLSMVAPSTPAKSQIEKYMGAADGSVAVPGGPAMTRGDMLSDTTFRGFMAKRAQYVAGQTGPSIDNQFEAVRKQLVDSKFEVMLATKDQKQRAGMFDDAPIADDSSTLAQASILRGLNPEMRRWKDRLKSAAQAQNHFCMVEQEDSEGYVSLARQAKQLFPQPDKEDPNYQQLNHDRETAMWQWIRNQFHISVIAHEMGHSVALRHNFVSNFDSINFHPQYWQLRTNNGQEQECKMDNYNGQPSFVVPHTDGNECVGPRWVDPVTEREVDGNIWKWQSTTVMDYPGDITQDTVGLGAYDRAAMRALYADVVDVDVDSTLKDNKDKYYTYLDRIDGFGGISGPLDFASNRAGAAQVGYGNGHYSANQARFNVMGDPIGEQANAADVLSVRYSGQKLLFRKMWDMIDMCADGGRPTTLASTPACPSYAQKNFAQDAEGSSGHVRHPYMFGSDEYADSGNQPVFRFDSGADVYEQQQYLINNYENRYIFTHFRKKNRLFNTGSVVSRIESRYFDKMQASTKGLGLYYGLLPYGSGDLYGHIPGFLMPHLLSSAMSFDEFARVMTRPEPGYYYYRGGSDQKNNAGCYPATAELDLNSPPEVSYTRICDQPADFVVPVGSGEGRFVHNDYDYTQGYNWSDYQTQVGSYYEKVGATYYVMEGYNHFLQNSKEDYIDGRSRNINYATIYPEQVRKLFSYMLQSDTSHLAPYITTNITEAGKEPAVHIAYPDWSGSNQTSLAMPAGAVAVDPLVGWEEQLPMMIYGFYFGGTTLTMDFVNMMRVATPNGTDAVSYGDDKFVRYTDPVTGVLYVARDYGRENSGTLNGVNRGIGARMVEYAKNLAAATYESSGVDEFGDAVWTSDANKQPVCKIAAEQCALNQQKIKFFSSNLDSMRELAEQLGYGPIDRR